ncbi:Sushi, von Willebrand factor type A, EGF and pentraxin domain-containing protein 1 [Holothuria leucospilota]|uniref:Sushi, von Willebrand factor type A, EGF and pentraxin domain-containing protein 1 n=1 Tax=Holothuria leucospilota TaxID=206669 RepID=A0A9Q1H5Q8_HOLLE|nr:Sushi, von Willebrand factor type A, EGF and pentraxin domain-containing protein 1 [Holothuria leucospilota]
MADTLYCSMGFGLDESSTSTCMDGKWVPEDPICLKICSLPHYLNFTNLYAVPFKYEYIVGEVIMYYCKWGYRLDRDPYATCTKEGFDPPELPQCEAAPLERWREVEREVERGGEEVEKEVEREVERERWRERWRERGGVREVERER